MKLKIDNLQSKLCVINRILGCLEPATWSRSALKLLRNAFFYILSLKVAVILTLIGCPPWVADFLAGWLIEKAQTFISRRIKKWLQKSKTSRLE